MWRRHRAHRSSCTAPLPSSWRWPLGEEAQPVAQGCFELLHAAHICLQLPEALLTFSRQPFADAREEVVEC
eukprot:3101675-Alexandrium_andersonii.AAC.1